MFRQIVFITLIALPSLAPAQPPDAEAQRQQELAKKPQWQRMLSGDDAQKAAELDQRISKLIAEDDYKGAIETAKERQALRGKSQGADHHETITAKFNVSVLEKLAAQTAAKRQEWRTAFQGAYEAQAFIAKGQYVKAYPAQKHYHDLCAELLGEDHPNTAGSYNSLAYNLYGQGKAVEALPFLQKALAIRLRVLGEDHPDTAGSYNNLAGSLRAQGKHAEAQPLLQNALEINRRLLGEDHPHMALAYNNVASNLDDLGKVAEAQPFYEKALEINRRLLGENHRHTAITYNSVAMNLNAQGKAAEAHPLFQKALEIRRRVLGEDHPDTANSYNNVAFNLDAQGKVAEAQPLYQKALEIRRRVLGEDHPTTAEGYLNLAHILDAQGKAAEAQPLHQKGLEIYRRVLGEDHPETARSYHNLASNLNAQGKSAEAQPFCQNSLEINRRVLGEEHPQTAHSYNNVALNLDTLGKAAEAHPFYQKALQIRRRVLGDDHPETASSYNNVASNLQALGKAAEAQPFHQQALEINRRLLGEDHPETARSYHNLAANLYALGKAAQAQPLFQKSLEIYRRVHGEDHPRTAENYYNLAFIMVALGKAAEAETLLPSAVFAFEASRLTEASGLDRASLSRINPRQLLAVLTQAREPLLAWGEIELSLARSLLDQQGDAQRNLTPAEEIEWTRERDRVAAVQPQILILLTKAKRSEDESAQLEKLLSERRQAEERLAVLAVKTSTRQVGSSDAIRAALPIDAAILLWVDVISRNGDLQEHWACVVRRTGDPKWERLPGTAPDGKWSQEDSALPAKLRAALTGSGPRAEVESLAQQLQAQRIAPVLKHLAGIKTLYVEAVHEMAGVPVELLAPHFTVSYIPSGTYLARRGTPLEKPKTLLVLGDPVFPPAKPTVVATSLPPGGLLINQVVPGGAAAKALLKAEDVLVSYGGTNVESVEQLSQLMAAKAGEKSVAIQIWRESENKLATYEITPGKLGAVLAKEPAREAIAARRKSDQLLASITRGEWGELPGTQVEVSELVRLFGPQAVTALTRSDASEPALDALRKQGELATFRYLHFATHGEANNVRAFDSKLILAQDHPIQLLAAPGEPLLNNEISASEVLDHWKLDAELVTLSACETAIGKSGGGDGMLGFAQAFLLAGSRSVCLSLWKVDDTATALTMDRFYRNLLGKREDGAKPMGKAAALAEAKTWLKNLTLAEATDRLGVITDGVSRGSKTGRKVIGEIPAPADSARDTKPYSHPKYWAAFILIGDPD